MGAYIEEVTIKWVFGREDTKLRPVSIEVVYKDEELSELSVIHPGYVKDPGCAPTRIPPQTVKFIPEEIRGLLSILSDIVAKEENTLTPT